ncbi:MAG: DNA repair protein RecO [Gemmatimonadaceae bacterium]
MSLLTTDAVVLHSFDYLETSRIFRFATRDAGVISVLARGARTSKRRFGTALDLFASGVAQVNTRPGRDLQQLAGFDLADARHAIALDLERFAAASAIAELALRFASAEEGGSFFDVLLASLDDIARAPSDAATDAGLASAWRLVAALGFAPALRHCASCHENVANVADGIPFSHAAGGIVCLRCAGKAPRGRTLPADARATLISWTNEHTYDDAEEPGSGIARALLPNEATRRAHLRLLREFLERHLSDGRELRAFEAWERAGNSVSGVRHP